MVLSNQTKTARAFCARTKKEGCFLEHKKSKYQNDIYAFCSNWLIFILRKPNDSYNFIGMFVL